MKLPRRNFLHLAASVAALSAVLRVATAQAYPSRPVRIIVPAAPSGAFDIMARLIGRWLSERLGQPFVIENRPGAGPNIGTEAGVGRPPDGNHPPLVGAAAGAHTATRSEALPDIPTVAEFVPGYEASYWAGIGAPKATPAEIVDKLNKEINAGLADPTMKARVADLGGDVLALSPTDFGKLIADETEKWGKVIRAANIKAE